MSEAAILIDHLQLKDAGLQSQSNLCRNVRSEFPPLRRRSIRTLQVNLGYYCNQSCVHCHVNASPYRTERMNFEVAHQVIECIQQLDIQCIDLTGGAPELNEYFRPIIDAAVNHDIEVIDRCNLTVLFEPGQLDTADYLADRKVSVVASLPCYLEENVSKQRGKSTFETSIKALKLLNRLGYGTNPDLALNLVFNPLGATLPPPQEELEKKYKDELYGRYGIVFNRLYTLTNLPINRFGAVLSAHDQYESYMQLLKINYEEANTDTVMCRDTVSVDYQGFLYDCDFNQMLQLPIHRDSRPMRLEDLLSESTLLNHPIEVAGHCFACTAGQGSSCTGALTIPS